MRKIAMPELKSPLLRIADMKKFNRALSLSDSYSLKSEGIGARAEKVLHRVLKLYIDENTDNHEIEYCGSVIDVKNDTGMYEIQTRSLDKLRAKLKKLSELGHIYVVCPLAYEKKISWINNETGEMSEPRISPKRECIYDAFKMLFGLRDILPNENITVRLLYMSVIDIRNLDGYGKDKKRRSTRDKRIPCEIFWELDLNTREDYISLLPPDLPEEFTASELSLAISRTSRCTFYILQLLLSLGAVTRIGTRGRARLYKKTRAM